MTRRRLEKTHRLAVLRRRVAFFTLAQDLEPEERGVDPYSDRVEPPATGELPNDEPPIGETLN